MSEQGAGNGSGDDPGKGPGDESVNPAGGVSGDLSVDVSGNGQGEPGQAPVADLNSGVATADLAAAAVAAAAASAGAGAGASSSAGAGAVLATADGPDGLLTLRRVGGGYEVVLTSEGWGAGACDRVILRSEVRRAEAEMVNLGLAPLRDRTDVTVLVAGLGMGYLLSALLSHPHVKRVDVVEHSSALIEWNKTFLRTLHPVAPLDDERVRVVHAPFAQHLAEIRRAHAESTDPKAEPDTYFLILMDLDDGPSVLSRNANAELYGEQGLLDIEEALRPGGVLCLWASQREPELLERLKARFQNIAEIALPVDVPGHSGLDYVYRCRRRPNPSKNPARAQA